MSLELQIRQAVIEGDEAAINALIDLRNEMGEQKLPCYYAFFQRGGYSPKVVRIDISIPYGDASALLKYMGPNYPDGPTVFGFAWRFTSYGIATPFDEAIYWMEFRDPKSKIWPLITKPIAKFLLTCNWNRIDKWHLREKTAWLTGYHRIRGICET